MLVVGVAVRTGVAAPTAAVAELRAIACCADHCPTSPRGPMTSHRCCFVSTAATDPASTQAAPTLARPDLAPIAFAAPLAPVLHPAPQVARADVALVRAGPPTYLQTLQIRR